MSTPKKLHHDLDQGDDFFKFRGLLLISSDFLTFVVTFEVKNFHKIKIKAFFRDQEDQEDKAFRGRFLIFSLFDLTFITFDRPLF